VTTDRAYAIGITTATRYLPEHSDPKTQRYAFAYTITLTNLGTTASQLIARHWIIEDAQGHTHEVKGLGVVGHQPLLQPGESFQYTSSSQLRTPTGRMHGSYFFVTEDGVRFDAEIPPFDLIMTRHLH
jgi:ApaG protein